MTSRAGSIVDSFAFLPQASPMRACVVVPSYQARKTLGDVIDGVVAEIPGLQRRDVLVVDDGSTDGTGDVARKHGAVVVSHTRNRGKGAALRTGLAEGG